MSKHRHRKSCCCCCSGGSNYNDPNDPANAFSADPRSFCALQQNSQLIFWLLVYSLYVNNITNCNILSKHDKLENYLICSHETLLRNAINEN